MNRYITAILIALSATGQAQSLQSAPKLVVNIAVDQLRTDYIEAFAPLYGPNGFKKLLAEGRVYGAASYSFEPIDRASAIASIVTGTSPYYNGIVSTQWLDRETLRPVSCTDDKRYTDSPVKLYCSTIGDELKVATNGAAIIYSIASDKDAAILSAGHAADGAVWVDSKKGTFTTSGYYSDKARKWLDAYKSVYSQRTEDEGTKNLAISQAAKECISANAMGRDDITDMLSVTLSAKGRNATNWQLDMESVYRKLDQVISDLVQGIEGKVGRQNVLFVLTSTGYTDEENVDYSKYRIPTGTFFINRTANLLNIYLGAIYGQGHYVETCFHNEIYLNHKLIEQKRLSLSEVLSRCQEFLIQNAGVRDVYTSTRLLASDNNIQKIRLGQNPAISGDILVEVAPGWQLYNEDNQEKFTSRATFVPFPIIIYGANIKAERISTPASVDRIAPTIAKSIRIRAPNACKADPLF
jgi:hypothetical protein